MFVALLIDYTFGENRGTDDTGLGLLIMLSVLVISDSIQRGRKGDKGIPGEQGPQGMQGPRGDRGPIEFL